MFYDIGMKHKADHLFQKWELPWQTIEVMLSGKSAIDLDRLNISDHYEATEFLSAYGFDVDDCKDQKFLQGVFIQSIHFIQSHLIPKEWQKGLIPPQKILDCRDIRQLLTWASDFSPSNVQTQLWACGIIRVMHTFTHVVGITRFMDKNQALEQIQDRTSPYVFRNSKQQLCFGSKEENFEIEDFQWKPPKSRNSMVLKLLHKKANVAETIYDLLGFRIVTKNVTDMALVLKKLSEFHMISFPNCNPNRSRNSVMDIDQFKVSLESLIEESKNSDLPEDEFHKRLAMLSKKLDEGLRPANPHSSNSYKSIQITCRQLVTSQNMRLKWLEKLEVLKKDTLKHEDSEVKSNLLRVLDFVLDWPEINDNREVKAFFPFEIQILHKDAFQETMSGEASHYRYKQSQIRAARKRVLGPLIRTKKKC